MPNQQYTVDNSDRGNANAFTVPGDEDGGVGDDSYALDPQASPNQVSVDSYVHVDNGWNVNVDVTLRGSHFADKTMTSAVDDGETVTINSGNVDFFDITSSHSYIELNVDPNATPGSGQLVITFQSRGD